VNAANVPHDMRVVAQWVTWRLEWSEARAAWSKVPYQPRRPSLRASSTDPSHWATFDAALAVYERQQSDGIGFVISNGFVGFDVDGCRNSETGVIDPEILAMVTALDSYTEASVRGGGIHTLLKGGPLPPGSRKGPYELYHKDRFFVVTGAHLPGTRLTVESRPAEILALHAQIFGPTSAAPHGLQSVADAAPDADAARNVVFEDHELPRSVDTLSDEDLLCRIFASKHGAAIRRLFDGDLSQHGQDHSAADMALCVHLSFWCQCNAARMDQLFRRSALMRKKWDRRDYRERTIAKAIAGTTQVYEPAADIPDLALEPGVRPAGLDLDTANLEAL
jgi:primase-polymerase (primpol)-like protein